MEGKYPRGASSKPGLGLAGSLFNLLSFIVYFFPADSLFYFDLSCFNFLAGGLSRNLVRGAKFFLGVSGDDEDEHYNCDNC